jgi:hypothetical protein
MAIEKKVTRHCLHAKSSAASRDAPSRGGLGVALGLATCRQFSVTRLRGGAGLQQALPERTR